MKAAPNQYRKLIYGLLIVILFGATIPYTKWLNEEKQRRDLGEAAIGQVDTGSFMLKLALLGGFRGIYVNALWTNAEELKKEHDWDGLKSTVDMITKLQPHFLSIWTFQSWNLAYNVSVEWDAPEDKYDWIKKGIQFVKEGVSKNKRSPDLRWDTAWTYYHKLGFADESIILRRLFHDDEDEDFKSYIDAKTGVRQFKQDNFQLGYGWFADAVALVDRGEDRAQTGTRDVEFVDPTPQRKGRPGDLAFRSMPAHAQTRYALSLEKMSTLDLPATFGEVAMSEWANAHAEWQDFGDYTWMSHNLVRDAEGNLHKEPVKLDDDTKPEVYKKLTENQQYWTSRWADQMNYRYWKDRCAAEMTKEGVEARRLFYEGTMAYKRGEFQTAVDRFKQGLDIWKELLEKHKDYRNDDFNKKDTGLVVKRYVRALRQLGASEPKDLPFRELMTVAEKDDTPDPFDQTEMLEPRRSDSGTPGRTSAPGR